MKALDAKYAPHEYYWITGIPVTMSKLLIALNWLAPSDYYDSEDPWYYSPFKNMYLDADMGTDAIAGPTVFHEAIHAYNHMTFGVFGISNRADEGMAYAAERMLWTLDALWFVETELNKLAPSRKLLGRNWRQAWREANGVIGYWGYYEATWTGLTRFDVSVIDVALVERFLGFELPCAHLAKVYNLIIQKKGIKCMRFICKTKKPECEERDIPLVEELYWVFR